MKTNEDRFKKINLPRLEPFALIFVETLSRKEEDREKKSILNPKQMNGRI